MWKQVEAECQWNSIAGELSSGRADLILKIVFRQLNKRRELRSLPASASLSNQRFHLCAGGLSAVSIKARLQAMPEMDWKMIKQACIPNLVLGWVRLLWWDLDEIDAGRKQVFDDLSPGIHRLIKKHLYTRWRRLAEMTFSFMKSKVISQVTCLLPA